MKKIIALFLFAFTTNIFASGYEGFWLISSGKSVLEFKKESNEEYTIKVAWIKDKNFPEGHDLAGKPLTDINNEDKSLRDRKIIGLQIGGGFKEKDGKLKGGWIYDSRKGKKYHANAKLKGDTMKLKGSIDKGGLFGVSDNLKKVNPADYGL